MRFFAKFQVENLRKCAFMHIIVNQYFLSYFFKKMLEFVMYGVDNITTPLSNEK